MVTYIYCVLTPTDGPLPRTGLSGAPVRVLRLPGSDVLEAWVSTVEENAFRVSGRALATQAVAHDQVVSAALASGRTPLPARFGSHFDDDDSCVAVLASHAPKLRAALRRLDGTVEMSTLLVRRDASIDPPVPPLPGREEPAAGRRYLESVRARMRRVDETQASTDEMLGELRRAVHDIARDESPWRRSGGIVSIAHLLRREDEARYRSAMRALPARNGVRVIVAGPRAPYNFAGPSTLLTGHDSGSPDRNG